MAESYLAQAEEILREAEGVYRRGVWNLAVEITLIRRSDVSGETGGELQ